MNIVSVPTRVDLCGHCLRWLGNDTLPRRRKLTRLRRETAKKGKPYKAGATMVGERRNGNLLVQLGPRQQAYPEELIRQRRTHDGLIEYLIRWTLLAVEDGTGTSSAEAASSGSSGSGTGGSGGSTSGESKSENILMWMSTEDVYANCPTLLGKRKAPAALEEEERPSSSGGALGSFRPPDVTFDEVELSDMKTDVVNLVRRARKQMAKTSEFAISLTHTIHVLSAYASIGSLVGVFKETGALDLLMELLCNKERQTRRSAGKMLRALASHDAGSRAYVLLSLSQQDGIEQHMDFDNRFTLLELFAETTSSEEHGISFEGIHLPQEHGISFEGIHLPQIPGKLLFSLVKRYLCVTSLMDKLNTAGSESSIEPSSSSPSSSSSAASEQMRLQREFEFTMAMANLISELVRVMGWDRNRQPPSLLGASALLGGGASEDGTEDSDACPRRALRSIFQPRFSASVSVNAAAAAVALATVSGATAAAAAATTSVAPAKKKVAVNGFKTRTDFSTRSAYVEYIQDNLKSGMMVRMLEDYEEVSSGDEGEFRYSNDGSPPVQVYWNSLSRTYWVHWHMIEILGSGTSGQAEKETQDKASTLTETLKLTTVSQTFFSKPPGGLYSLPYLCEGEREERGQLSRAEWWEVLFFIKKLEPKQQQEVNHILLQNLDDAQMLRADRVSLLQLSVPGEVARQILHYLRRTLQSSCLGDLVCSHAFTKHYLRRGGAGLQDEDPLAAAHGLLGGRHSPPSSSSGTAGASSSAMGSVSKKPKKEPTADGGASGGGSDTESELPTEDEAKYPEDLEEKMKAFNSSKVQGKKTALEKLGEVVDMLKKGGGASDTSRQLAAIKFMSRLLEEDGVTQEKKTLSDSAQALRDHNTELWDVQTLGTPVQVNGTFCSVLKSRIVRCSLSVCNGLLVVIMLISSHKSLAEQLVACGISAVLKKCLSSQRSETTTLAIIALNHISMVHKLEKQESAEEQEFKDMELKMLVVSLKNMTASKEVIQTLEQLLCEPSAQLDDEKNKVTHSRDAFQDLVVQQFIRFLYRLASLNKDYAVVMCRLGTKDALVKALDKHSTNLLLVTELRDLISDCEKYASLYKKMTTSVLAGCIQMVLGQIEEHRRSHQPINIPFFDVFLRNLCQGSSVELKEDKCWEKVEVSSNHHRANKLTDKNPKTYWESNGCTGSHFINIYMLKGVVIRQLAVLVASEDSSYMPARIVVLGGDDPANVNTELNTVNVPPSANRIVLLENMTRFWSIVQIRIKRCQQGGIDTRVHGFEVLGPKPTFWPVFKEQLCCRTYLFYTTKAHTWCQEILEDRAQLLQLFNKLNSALKHEQMFADRFLPDAEAAEALGRTCWEALITPIVQSITLSDTPVLSPLAWLLSEYLDNAESSKRYKTRAAIFNSRVRRLTHLLVHVDTSRVDTEELKPPVKSKGINRSKDLKNGKEGKNKEAAVMSSSSSAVKPKLKNTSSIAGIALCWQGVVQRQVKKFLDSTCSLPDFVERYRAMYLRLKNAMEELFGQQTAFVLALRQGFSAALLQLSILTSMHVSERFAQYIDLMIQESCGDSGNVETLSQLQQFLEPMLFLSGLELANTFEHFYSKVWLESAVIEQIGSCFPNRFPQQMLTNLRESQELQQEFHLYRLQQLDKTLQDLDEEDVSVDVLQKDTGLSTAVLAHALEPLTGDKGILMQDPAKGELRLNPRLLSQSGGAQSVFHLLPKQTYLNVDEDAARTLERKRNYIYCLIVQIMKSEREMHIDNLVFRVLDTCWKQEALRSPGAVRFSCSTTDVLSCVIHVINKGYVRRNDDSPHILEFLPEDPSTPQKGQAQFSFSRSDLKKNSTKADISLGGVSVAGHRAEDAVLEAVLFSMGRTMSQEDVQQLMQRTVQQVAGTLSLDLDRAQHLLVHCRWNVDLLIQRYTDDPDALVLAAGLKIRNAQPPPSPAVQCPVCLVAQSGGAEPAPTLCCNHYCCRSCWQEYLTARIEQNLVMNCNCPITDCRAQPTAQFFYNILTDKDTISKGCDQILCKENIGSMGTCSKCCWSSCFSCNFPEAHYPASCSHMSQWMDDGGYYEGMTMEAQSKHLAKLISKRCPSCQAQIEKNEGCLHMTCAKCNHGFCWRCLKPWKPTHKDYYNCSAMVSKAARQEKKFQDYNERCTFHNQAKDFAIGLENKVSSINEALQMKALTFVIDACKILAQARKVLAYSCVYSYYNQDTEKMDVMEQQTEALDLHTNALQILLEETLLQCTDLASCVRLLKPEHLNTGLELIRRIQERLVAILQHSTQDFRVGYQTKSADQEAGQASNLNHTGTNKEAKSERGSESGDSDNNNNTGEEGGDEAEEDEEYDDDYVPEWHEDYDEEDIDEDDFFSDNEESENLESDFSPLD
ncbi:hypothetical protein AALO_G00229190 [Alosa alosa]|uniref:Cullin-9 n=1 Tax=Alosa alosa TaxID=278164 RepID=A0AAV6FTV4_9TELE|nr:hypothetical protein AALO_G00229190 [Alosa alosa]